MSWWNRHAPVPAALANCRDLSQKGLLAAERGDWHTAETNFKLAIEHCDTDAEARRCLAEALWRRNQPQEAIAQLVAATRRAPQDAALHLRLAEMNFAAGSLNDASHEVREALDLDPRLAAGWTLRGRLLQKLGRLDQAQADLLRATQLAPHDPQIWLALAEVYHLRNQPERELAALQSLLDLGTPGDEPPEWFFLTGEAYAALDRWEDAAECFTRAANQDPTSAEPHYRLAEARFRAGQRGAAEVAARNALQRAPEHPGCRALLERLEVARRQEQFPRR